MLGFAASLAIMIGEVGVVIGPENGARECYVELVRGVVSLSHDPDGPYPVIVPCEGVRLQVDGIIYETEVAVKIGDVIDLSLENEERLGTWSLEVAKDGLTAFVELAPSMTVTRTLLDAPRSPSLTLQVLEGVEKYSPVQLDQLMSALRREGIIVGVDLTVVSAIVSAQEAGKFIIARGATPVQGQDAAVEILFEQEVRKQREIRPESVVDFRARFDYSAAREGQLLVRKIPRVLGRDGQNVRGETIFAKEPLDIELVAGDGVRVSEQGDQLIATTPGRPVLKQRQKSIRVDIRPDMLVSGDVDLRSGNVSFVGDITIQGDVTAGFSVWAGGNIKVRGVAENSHVQACSSVAVVGNIISSQVVAGPPPGLMRTFTPILREIEKDIRTVHLAIEQLKKRIPANKQSLAGRLVGTLIDQRLIGFMERVRSLSRELRKLDRRLTNLFGADVLTTLATFLEDSNGAGKTEAHLSELAGAISTLQTRLEEISAQNAHITARNVINSTLVSTGDISIINGGCYNSWLQAGGKIVVQGVVRGGKIKAGTDVVVRELGSESGVTTSISVPTPAKVHLGTAWENSVVIVGARHYRFDKKQTGVTLYLVDGSMVVK